MNIHPFAPIQQAQGYLEFIQELSGYLINLTEMDNISYQSNSGATGEYVGLLAIKKYFESRDENYRKVILIP